MRQHILEQAEAIAEDTSLKTNEKVSKWAALNFTKEEETCFLAWIKSKIDEEVKKANESANRIESLNREIARFEKELDELRGKHD